MKHASFDTNVAIYALLDHRDLRKTALAQKLLHELATTGVCSISTQVLNEFANVATRKIHPPLQEAVLIQRLDDLSAFEVITITDELVRRAVRRHFSQQVGFYDALVVEAALSAGAEILYTEDLQHGMKFDSMTIVNPFL